MAEEKPACRQAGLKIVLLSYYSGVVYRGVETFVHELANRLVTVGHEVTVFQSGPKLNGSSYKTVVIDDPSAVEALNWKISFVPYLNDYALKVKAFTQKCLKNMPKDIDILFPTNGQWESLLCKIWTKKNKIKLVLVGQSGPGIDDRLNLLTFPDTFVALTEPQRKWARSANPFTKTVTIPNGVDLAKFNSGVKKLSVNLPRPIILCVAALDFWKRQDLAIKAVSQLEKGSLFLVGKGGQDKKLRILGEKYLPGRFMIASFKHEEMPAVFAAADIFTYPTVAWESFGIVMVEAMALGLPVVASDDPIRKEIVGNAGIFVDPKDTNNYTQALKKCLDADWGNKPRLQAQKFGWDEIAKKYEKLFLEV